MTPKRNVRLTLSQWRALGCERDHGYRQTGKTHDIGVIADGNNKGQYRVMNIKTRLCGIGSTPAKAFANLGS